MTIIKPIRNQDSCKVANQDAGSGRGMNPLLFCSLEFGWKVIHQRKVAHTGFLKGGLAKCDVSVNSNQISKWKKLHVNV